MKVGGRILGVIVGLGLVSGTSAMADSLLFDRGLPTANLNNAAGPSRSNVAWADSENTNAPTNYYLPGDDFTLAGSGPYHIDDIRVWVVGGSTLPTGLSLLGGVAGSSTMDSLSNTFNAAQVHYSDGSDYQGTSGTFHSLYQVDFSVNVDLNVGQTFDFFLNGPWTPSGSGYVNPFLHASNGPLSGSTQDGADGQFLWLHVNNSSQDVETWYSSGTPVGTSPFSAGWDKNSDGNVQVFGVATPLPPSLWGGLALLGLLAVTGGAKRFRRQLA
ncbi:MAG TPA: hypothetical protein VK797_10905 [Tepidisphaeraceae bacterium]|nr:hypothetical protein [Tepidisphaeraceae bacterium]